MSHRHEPAHQRRLPLLAHGSVSRPLILTLLFCIAVLGYGWFLVTTPSQQDARICATWLQQYTERVNSNAVFEKVGSGYQDITATSHGIYAVVDIRVTKPCVELPRPIKAYFTHNKLGMLMYVRVHAEGETDPCCTELF